MNTTLAANAHVCSGILVGTRALKQQGLDLLERGWSIIPVRGKKAAVEWIEFQKRRMSKAEFVKVFGVGGVTGIAVVLGEVSGGLCCRDFDELGAYERWLASAPKIAATLPAVRTARGAHVYLVASPSLRSQKLKDGEFRAEGNYCVLPPSLHPKGAIYEWVNQNSLYKPVPTIDPVALGLLACGDVIEEADEVDEIDEVERIRDEEVVGEGFRTIHHVVQAAIPKRTKENYDHLFVLARARLSYAIYLRSEGKLGPGEDLSIETKHKIFEEWHEQSAPYLDPKQSKEQYWSEFLRAVAKARVPIGGGLNMKEVVEIAKHSTPPSVALRFFHDEKTILLIKVCRELWRINSPEPFWVSCADAAKYIRFDHDTQAHRRLQELVGGGIIKVHTLGDRRNATRYLYLLPLDEEVNPGTQSSGEEMML